MFTLAGLGCQYAVADAFTICDGYHQAIMAPTSPNRMYFWTGTSSGWISNPNDYEVDFGPDAGTSEVTTYPELLQAAGISWQVYTNNQVGDSGSYPDYFLGDYGEHPSYTPDYGAHYVNTVLQTLFSNPDLWKTTALFITYDEHDGFFDHQLPPYPEVTVTDEYIGGLPIGPGTRVPMLICSPWTRGGYVDSNVYDHTSMLQFLAAWTGVKPANVTPWRASVTGDLTTAFDFEHPDFSIPKNIPTLEQTWKLTQLTGGSTTPPAEGDQQMPAQEPGTRPHRPTNYQLHADVTVNRTTSLVTAALTNTGTVGVCFAVYPDNYLAFGSTPFTVLPSSPRSYVWDATATGGKYAFSVYGPDGFLTSFAGRLCRPARTAARSRPSPPPWRPRRSGSRWPTRARARSPTR